MQLTFQDLYYSGFSPSVSLSPDALCPDALLQLIQRWFQETGMALHPLKTEGMWIGKRRNDSTVWHPVISHLYERSCSASRTRFPDLTDGALVVLIAVLAPLVPDIEAHPHALECHTDVDPVVW
jgi:hypothetical protein